MASESWILVEPMMESMAVDYFIQKLISSMVVVVPREGFGTARTQVWPEAWLQALMASHQDIQLASVKIGMRALILNIVKVENLECNSISMQFQHRFIIMVVMFNYEQPVKVFDDGDDHSIHKQEGR